MMNDFTKDEIGELNQKLSNFIMKDFESAFSVKTLNKNNFEEFAQKLKDLGLKK
jgi:hypothetical protein